jgi:putative ABC transport system permease protein
MKWRDRDGELDEELRNHLEMAARDRIDRGEDAASAAVAARREFGNVLTVKEVTREAWGWRWLERLAQDLRYAVRLLRRNPGFTAVAIVSLGLGIGANTAIFQVIDAIRLRTLPVPNASELAEVRLVERTGVRGNHASWHPSLSNPIWEQIRARQQAFSGMFATGAEMLNLANGGEMRNASGLWVSGDYFRVLGIRAAAGRLIDESDDVRGCTPRAVLSYAFWQREYGGDPSVVGRAISLEGKRADIIGVSERGFFGLEVGRMFDVAVPICSEPTIHGGKGRLESGTDWWLMVVGRLKPGWTLATSTAQLKAVSPDLFQTTLPANYPTVSVPAYLKLQLGAVEAGAGISWVREEYSTALWLLLGIAAIVLLIACANLANLLLARASARQREFAVRLGVGASRGRVVRQLLTESLLLAALGAACGVFVATTLSSMLVSFIKSSDQTLVLDMGVNWRVLGFAALLAMLTCILFGVAPALRATRVSVDAVLRSTGRTASGSRERAGFRRALVVSQVALSLVLLAAALLFARTLRNLLTLDPGFRSDGVLIARVDLRPLQLPVDARSQARLDIVEAVRTLPGVGSVAHAAIVPLSGDGWGNDVWVGEGASRRKADVAFNSVTPGYFSTLGTPLLAGRDFDNTIDTPQAPLAAIVNETFARQLFDGQNPVGHHFTVESTPSTPERDFHIVGYVKDAKYMALREQIMPGAFLADAQVSAGGAYAQLVVRTSLPAETITHEVTARLAEMNPRIAVDYTIMDTQIADTLLRERLTATLSGFFGGLAAVLTIVGLYGVVAYSVARRTNEIGIRMALGASHRAVMSLILREAGTLVAAGLSAGVLLAAMSGPLAATLLFGLKPTDPITLGAAAAVLAAVALLASYVPARGATRIQPVQALRVE